MYIHQEYFSLSTRDLLSWIDVLDPSPSGNLFRLAARKPYPFSDALVVDFFGTPHLSADFGTLPHLPRYSDLKEMPANNGWYWILLDFRREKKLKNFLLGQVMSKEQYGPSSSRT